MRLRKWVPALALGPWIVLVGWFGARLAGQRLLRDELERLEADMAGRRFGQAYARAQTLQRRWPGQGQVEFDLGVCAHARGRLDEAIAAWARVPDDSPYAGAAALARGRLALERGRYAAAEKDLAPASRAGADVAAEARRQLGRLYWLTGRLDEARALARRQAERADDPAPALMALWQLDALAYPEAGMRAQIEAAQQTAPDDDRVWLALADLAVRGGHYEEARAWLGRCLRARPDDPVVWRAWLRWARAADRPDEALLALPHIPADDYPADRLLAIRAWLAARRGDRAAERALLEALAPRDTQALERLAELAALEGRPDAVAGLRRRKAAADAAHEYYRALMDEPDLAAHAPELARAAEPLGRGFDAACWWRLAARRDPALAADARAAQTRLEVREPAAGTRGQTLADVMPAAERAAMAAAAPASVRRGGPRFRDEAAERGLRFVFDNGRTDLRQLPETMSGGVGLLDYDGDGWVDVYCVQGGSLSSSDPDARVPFRDRLFRNRGDGTFEDATAAAGLADCGGGYGHGVAVGDYDNDGLPDLLVTRWHAYALYHNAGGGRLEDVTARAGFDGDRGWPTAAAWADLDGDGDLDLYVCHYLAWDPIGSAPCDDPQHAGRRQYCHPRSYAAEPDRVYRNDRGRFVDVTAAAGIVDRDGRGLGVIAADLDGDAKVDLFVANDTSANLFLRNQGPFRFVERAYEAGLAANAAGGYLAGMGVACGDTDGDGRPEVAVTNFYGESTTYYANLGSGLFCDRTDAAGLAAPTRFVLGFGLAFLDADNDGRLDLAQANGHVNDLRPDSPYAMSPQLFLGDGRGRFADDSERAGPPWREARIGRGLAVGDIDNDGRADVLIVGDNAPLALLRNETPSAGSAVTLLLEGTVSNRDAVGARVRVTAGGRTQVGWRTGGGSYLSASDARLRFGLGAAGRIDRVEVTWPSGRVDYYDGLSANAGYRLREGDAQAHTLAGFPARGR